MPLLRIQDVHELFACDRLLLVEVLRQLIELRAVLGEDVHSLFVLRFHQLHNALVDLRLRLGRARKRRVAAEILIVDRLERDHVEVVAHAVARDHRAGELRRLLDIVRRAGRDGVATARYSDIIFPVVTHFEESFITGSRVKTDTNFVNQILDPMYECKTDWQINELIAQRLGINWGRDGKSDVDVMKIQWAGAKVPEKYKELNPEFKLPTFEEMQKEGNVQLFVKPETSVIDAARFAPGEFPTDTGKINFYSPFLAERGRLKQKAARAQYVRPPEGIEDLLEGKKGAKGIAYSLQFTTPHMPNRSHSSFDNTTSLMDAFPHCVFINPEDAQKRGIADGDEVYVYNDAGCMKIPAQITLRQLPGVVSIGEGAWYQPSPTEKYEAWFDLDGDGKPEKHIVAVDVGGAVNTLTTDRDIGAADPVLHLQTNKSGGFAAGGNLCEVSKQKPA